MVTWSLIGRISISVPIRTSHQSCALHRRVKGPAGVCRSSTEGNCFREKWSRVRFNQFQTKPICRQRTNNCRVRCAFEGPHRCSIVQPLLRPFSVLLFRFLCGPTCTYADFFVLPVVLLAMKYVRQLDQSRSSACGGPCGEAAYPLIEAWQVRHFSDWITKNQNLRTSFLS